MDGESVAKYYTSTEEAYAGDNLRKDTEIVVIDQAARSYCIIDDSLRDENENACSYGDEGVGGKSGATLTQLAFEADKDAANQGDN